MLVGAALARHASVGSVAKQFTGGRVTLWRLDTDASGVPCRCNACRSHAANKIFTTRQAAVVGRAHVGCRCQPVPVSASDVGSSALLLHSHDGGRSVDLRHVSHATRIDALSTFALDPEL